MKRTKMRIFCDADEIQWTASEIHYSSSETSSACECACLTCQKITALLEFCMIIQRRLHSWDRHVVSWQGSRAVRVERTQLHRRCQDNCIRLPTLQPETYGFNDSIL